MGALGINHVTILVNDKEKAVKFYSEILGLEIFPVGKSTWMKIGSQFLHITGNSGKVVADSFYHFAIEVDSFEKYVNDLIEKGIEIFDLDEDLNKVRINCDLDTPTRQYFVNDPDGNLIELINKENSFFQKGLV